MQTGKIDIAKPSKSGKTLGVKIGSAWYSTDLWELQNMVGQTITITDSKVVPMPDGGSITYLNAYTNHDVPPGIAPPPRPTTAAPQLGRTHPNDALLLEFVGRCMSGYNYATADDAQVRTRCRMLYKLGKDVLNGSIDNVETAPRRAAQPTATPRPESEDLPPAEDYDDDIPF